MNIAENIGPVLAGPIPPEKPLSFFKFMKLVQESPIATFPRIAYEEPVWESKFFLGNTFVVSDPAGVKRILLDNVANYPKAKLEIEVLGAAFGDGLLTSDGDKWRSHRRIMSPSFDHKSLVSYAPAMAATTAVYCNEIGAREGETVDVADEMTKLTLRIISQTMFSANDAQLGEMIGSTLVDGQALLTFGIVDIIPVIGRWHMRGRLDEVRKTFGKLDAAMYGLISARNKKTGDAPKDLLDRLIAARDSESGNAMTDLEVRDETVIIFLAGHETTAVAMTFIWYLLSQHTAVEAKLHAELDAVLGGRVPDYADLEKLPYTRMVIEESMRLYPPAPGLSMRQAREDDEVCGHKIRKGAQVMIVPWVLHRHRALWDNPHRFDPERFSPENSAKRQRFSYLPFGGGPRICIGAALAMTEASLILATMAQRYRLKLTPGQNVELYDRITLRPRNGMKMVFERR